MTIFAEKPQCDFTPESRQRVSFRCEPGMYNLNWIVPSGQQCIETPRTVKLQWEPPQNVMVVYRNESFGKVWRAAVPDPLYNDVKMEIGGKMKSIQFREIAILHLMTVKGLVRIF